MKKIIKTSCSVILLLTHTGILQAAPALEEVIVTAQKRQESLQDVPISVSAISGEAITANGINRLDDLAAYVPNLSILDNFVGSDLKIRGIGTSAGNAGFEQSVATFIDGVYFGRERSSLAAFLDTERVEVLKGPQPIFFGQNAIAGALNITTRKPGDEAEGYINASYGTDDEYSVEFAYGGPLTDTLGVRVALRANGMDGYFENLNGDDIPERDNLAGRIILDYQPTDELGITFKYEASRLEQSGYPLSPSTCNAEMDGNPATPNTGIVACDYALNNVPGYTAGPDDQVGNGGYLPPPPGPVMFLIPVGFPVVDASGLDFFQQDDRDLDTSNAALTLEYDFGSVILNAITGYVEYESENYFDVDETPYALVHPHVTQDFEQISQEIRLTSDSNSALDWMAGVYYQSHDLDARNELPTAYLAPLPFPPFPPGAFANITLGQNHTEESEWLSIFFAGTWHINEDWRLQFGLRYTEVEKDGSIRSILGGVNCGGPCAPGAVATGYTPITVNPSLGINPATGTPAGYDDTFADDDINPTIGLQWDMNDDIMVYAKYAEAFKSGGFNAGNSVPASADSYVYDSEEAETFEIGAKMKLLDERMELNAAIWTTEYTNLQVSFLVQDTASFDVQNAAVATSRGIEIDGRFAATENLMLSFAGTLTEAEFDKYIDAPCSDFDVASGACGTNGAISRAGAPLIWSPEWSANLGADYLIPLASGYQVTLAGNLLLSDGYESADGNTLVPGSRQGSYETLDIRAAFGPEDGDWKVSAYARNITDKQILTLTGPGALSGFNTLDQVISRGASYGVMFNYKL